MESKERAFGSALAANTSKWLSVATDESPNVMVFRYESYYVVCNDDMLDEFDKFVENNHELIKNIFPSEFKCFKLDETTTIQLLDIALHSNEDYEFTYSNRFVVIDDKLYLVKMLHCNNRKNVGFAMMKCDLIEDDASLGSFMYVNQNVNFLLKKLGGIRGNRFDVLKADGWGRAGLIKFSIELFGMLDPIASDAYVKNNPGVSDDNVYVEAGSYKLPNFDTIDSVKMWIGDEKNENNCPFINIASIVLESNHLKLRKWLNKLCKTHYRFSYAVVKKSNKAVCEF